MRRPSYVFGLLVPAVAFAALAASARTEVPVVATERWGLVVELPGDVDVGGLGRLGTTTRSVFLVSGPLAQAEAVRCSLDVDAAHAHGAPTAMPPAGLVRFVVEGDAVRADDADALTPRGPVRIELRVGPLLKVPLDVEVSGALSLHGRRDGDGVRGAAVWRAPRERVRGPSYLDVSVPQRDVARGSFTMTKTRAATCRQLLAG